MSDQPPAPAEERPDASAPKPLRADARRNRDTLVEVAAQAFAEHGVDASLQEIAKRAGVGIGTLYRHFPTREHLVEVVYRREVEGLCQAADELARSHPADIALELWMQRFVDYIATKRGLATSLRLLLTTNATLFSDTSGRVSGALKGLIERAAAAGRIRADIDASDVLHALGGIYSAPNTSDWRERSGRLVRLLMDGLRFGAGG
ncbi:MULTISPECIES: TetR/AcrR family transcriptional regulator [unclassified Mesorhizobium]|uniref:TetR/AcrR family transcriptional regulator n=1 Tax=unclassified Mesorhizobium TaxID=325217 RepID=UPI000BAEA878|nr:MULTISPECIES: TetR/AcrR family transcriptional regulator [unclassified Mesorhizobium]TGT56964.1 TetR/AcrR family transcriptional regulator [Mesorhizobium sp. M00.F.Ca.ET.170.01.1.1]AZO12905.1 TetR/AcrR family transcriptional regulator [Mesorhizobium sp. M3A.F.Ca.ET.080.04.2.1]PBB85604.1 TetR family transcriptional regulator [Mesorhizobium sp. WSM3876]RWB71847.1 MAG: TetR/AcrR family transcriptional regulator [Mesorhizobium sp.]RWB85131.1 MAG: TetR/AcrR family transcriptional regulator [Meso